ncbi:MAG: 3-oxoacyl-ACP synthase, partial [Muribaculaceae bacterium]
MAYIKSIHCFTPPYELDNNELQAQLKNSCVEKTAKGVGVLKRHIADNDTTAGDMAVEAANKLFEKSGIKREDIDFI